MAAETILWILLLIFLIGILPLYIIVKILGGRVTVLKVLVIKIAAVLIAVLLSIAFGPIGPIAVAIMLMILYMVAFRIGIIRAFLAWLLEGVVLLAIIFALGIFGITAIHWDNIIDAFRHLATYL